MSNHTDELEEILGQAFYIEDGEYIGSYQEDTPIGFDIKQAILDWHNKQTLELLDRLSSQQESLHWWTGGEYEKTTAVDMRAIAAERELLTKPEAEL